MRVESEQAHRAGRRPAAPTPAQDVMAEDVVLDERLIVAPTAGTFFPAFTEVSAAHSGIVALGDEIGVLVQSGDKYPVTSPFTGRLMGMLAMPGERVRIHQPIAWLTTADDEHG